MLLRRTLDLSTSDPATAQRAADYWGLRGFAMQVASSGCLIGARGSLAGRLFSTDPCRWPATLTVRFGRARAIECDLALSVGAIGLNEWNRPLLDLEWGLFRDYVQTGEADLARLRAATAASRREVRANLPRLCAGLLGPPRLRQDAETSTLMVLGVGVLCAAGAYAAGVEALALSAPESIAAPHNRVLVRLLVSLVVCPAALLSAACAGGVLRQHQLRMESDRCMTVEDAARRFGSTSGQIRRLIEDRAVKPRFIVDGLPVYDPEEITQAGRLLRPSAMPDADRLLRSSVLVGPPDELALLRPADDASP